MYYVHVHTNIIAVSLLVYYYDINNHDGGSFGLDIVI